MILPLSPWLGMHDSKQLDMPGVFVVDNFMPCYPGCPLTPLSESLPELVVPSVSSLELVTAATTWVEITQGTLPPCATHHS
jgi:hypothetical protein